MTNPYMKIYHSKHLFFYHSGDKGPTYGYGSDMYKTMTKSRTAKVSQDIGEHWVTVPRRPRLVGRPDD